MKVNLIPTLFVLSKTKNTNIRKNDILSLKVLVKKDNTLPKILFEKDHMKSKVRQYLESIIHTNIFHLEQVFSHDTDNDIDIIYLAITNEENIKGLDNNYELVDFNIKDNKYITLDNKEYEYTTEEIKQYNNIEYIHNIKADSSINKILLELLISYKRIRSNIDNTDIIFKFMPEAFTLEEVRILYELIKDTKTDKSNFRKKIVKYCEKLEEKAETAYRPSQKYKFKPLEGDNWI